MGGLVMGFTLHPLLRVLGFADGAFPACGRGGAVQLLVGCGCFAGGGCHLLALLAFGLEHLLVGLLLLVVDLGGLAHGGVGLGGVAFHGLVI